MVTLPDLPTRHRIRVLHPHIGRLIKSIRLRKRLSQDDLARKSKVSRTTISRFESGKHVNIGVAHLEAIAHALGMSLNTCITIADQSAQAHPDCVE
jgi:transcriptional regulator with XRE-family HTH domain